MAKQLVGALALLLFGGADLVYVNAALVPQLAASAKDQQSAPPANVPAPPSRPAETVVAVATSAKASPPPPETTTPPPATSPPATLAVATTAPTTTGTAPASTATGTAPAPTATGAPKPPVAAQVETESGPWVLHFDSGGTIPVEGRTVLPKVVAALQAHPGATLSVVGHADERGPKVGNDNIANARAQTVAGLISARGVLRASIRVASRGSSEPVDPGHTTEAYQANRRVEITLVGAGSQ